MVNINKVIEMGRLVKEPELKQIENKKTGKSTTVCNFTIAVERMFKIDGQPSADFFNCVAFDKPANFVGQYCPKGTRIAVEGRLQNDSWEDKEKKKHTVTKIMVEKVYHADGKRISNDNLDVPPTADDDDLPL